MRDAVKLIRATRRQRGLTHDAMAKAAHASRQTPANVEAGPKDPGLMMIVRLWRTPLATAGSQGLFM